MPTVQTPFQVFVDLDGTALEGASIFVGQPDSDPEAMPLQLYWNAALTIPAVQPLRTTGGIITNAGGPAEVYAAQQTYSIRVRDRAGRQVWVKTITGGVLHASRLTFPIPTGPASDVPGPSNNTRVDLVALKAAAITDLTSLYDGNLWFWTTGDFTGKADDLRIVKANSTALTAGAWVRQDKARDMLSVIDFGAKGGLNDDWAAFNAALQTAVGTVSFGGTNYAVGAEVVVPYNSAGYRLGQTLVIPPGVRLRFLAGRQIIAKTHSGDMYIVKDGGQIVGGDHLGGVSSALPGHCFRFESINSGQGRQLLRDLRARTNWSDEVLFYELGGGSQSLVLNCILATGSGKFAVKVEDGFTDGALPRKLSGIETDGQPGFDFGGCNDMMVSDSFCGGVRFTIESRGVHTTGLRVANQVAVDVLGHNHVLLGGWNPVPTFKNAVDHTGSLAQSDVIVWGAYCNSGRPIDQTGNTRNSITFAESAVVPVLRSDATPLTLTPNAGAGYPNGYRAGWGVKRSGATYTFRLDLNLNLTGGAATPGGMGLGFLYLDMPAGCLNYGAEQLVTGLRMEYSISGTTYKVPIVGLVQSVGGNDRIQLLDVNENPITGNQAPGGAATPGWVLKRIRGQFDYSPA